MNFKVTKQLANTALLPYLRARCFPDGINEIGCGTNVDYGYEICTESFADMKYLRKVDFPNSLKKIGNNTFANCPRLKKVTLPDSIEEIGYGAFQNSGLTEANIPKSLVGDCGGIFRGTPFEKSREKKAPGGFGVFNDVLLYKGCEQPHESMISHTADTAL